MLFSFQCHIIPEWLSDLFHLSNCCSGSLLFVLCFVPVQSFQILQLLLSGEDISTEIFVACNLMSVLCVANNHVYQKRLFSNISKVLCDLLQKKNKNNISMQKPVSSWNIWCWLKVMADSIILRKSVHNSFVPWSNL